MANVVAPQVGIIGFNNGKSLLHDVAKNEHFRVIEFPKIVADWVDLISTWVAGSNIFADTAKMFSSGLDKILSAESLVYLAGDICELPAKISSLKDRVIKIENGEVTSEALTALAHEVRRLACFIGGTIADWYDTCSFFKNVQILSANARHWFMPTELIAKIGGTMNGASKFFDLAVGYEKTTIVETQNEELNKVKQQFALEKDNADLVYWGSIFAINAVGLAALALGVAAAPVLTLGLTTTIFASRIVSHYNNFQINNLNEMDPQTIAAVADLKR